MPLYCVSLGGSREAGMIYRVLCIVTVQTVACGSGRQVFTSV